MKYIKSRLFSAVFIGLFLLLSTNLSAQTTTLWVGESYTCDVTSSMMGLTSDMSWSTSGGYFSLSGTGAYRRITVTQYFGGTSSVTCTWKYRLYSGDQWRTQSRTWRFSCQDNPVSIYPTQITLSVGETTHINYSHRYTNSYTSAANAYFTNTNPSVATITDTGLVKAVSPGTTYINVHSKISANAPYCLVTVVAATVKPEAISLPSSKELKIGESIALTPSLAPSDAVTTYTWSSDKKSVATVSSSGVVTGISKGTATITVSTDNGLSAQCSITVNNEQAAPDASLIERAKANINSLKHKSLVFLNN